MSKKPDEVMREIALLLKPEELLKVDTSRLTQYAQYLADDIKKRTRLGYGVAEGATEKEKLAALADSTKKQRAKHTLSPMTSKNRSNLTDTGQMLDSLTGEAISQTKGRVYLKGERNNDIAQYHETGTPKMPARPFMHADQLQVKRLTDYIRRDILDKVKKAIT